MLNFKEVKEEKLKQMRNKKLLDEENMMMLSIPRINQKSKKLLSVGDADEQQKTNSFSYSFGRKRSTADIHTFFNKLSHESLRKLKEKKAAMKTKGSFKNEKGD